ncbi:hypothetical protein EVAR_3304_1 [Eumeta japonica]|uniref:Uncharacterized protein n=1 Tax=Eumeta variegata TaxID=151549 RepID=A0A4C1SV83_EUMVA|nr:hypothetical protein EVAR_3304_1 [Eumeta japonica]
MGTTVDANLQWGPHVVSVAGYLYLKSLSSKHNKSNKYGIDHCVKFAEKTGIRLCKRKLFRQMGLEANYLPANSTTRRGSITFAASISHATVVKSSKYHSKDIKAIYTSTSLHSRLCPRGQRMNFSILYVNRNENALCHAPNRCPVLNPDPCPALDAKCLPLDSDHIPVSDSKLDFDA